MTVWWFWTTVWWFRVTVWRFWVTVWWFGTTLWAPGGVATSRGDQVGSDWIKADLGGWRAFGVPTGGGFRGGGDSCTVKL